MTDTALIGPVEAPHLHVMSYNIRRRLPHLMPRSPDRWAHRQPLLKRLLQAEQPALLGVQEALFDQAGFVRHALPLHRSRTGSQHRRRRLPDLLRRPAAAGARVAADRALRHPGCARLTTWGNRVPRIVVDAVFRDLATGIQFQAVNTHLDHRSRASRLRAADELQRIVQASPLPTLMTGDFNTDADSDPYDALTGQGLLLDT